MDTTQKTREQVSALADGELHDAELDAAFAALRNADAGADWELYHRIGDALRSEEVANVALSNDFSSRLSARLAAEPAIVAPVGGVKTGQAVPASARRWALPGFAAAAAMAGIAFVATPQLMVALNGEATSAAGQPVVAEVRQTPPVVPVAAAGPAVAEESGAVVLRDPHVDDYLLAHQRFSPSIYSTAQYARSATLATQPDK